MNCILLILFLSCLWIRVESVPEPDRDESDFYEDKSQWIDPGDMLKFESSSVVMTEERGTQTTDQCSCDSSQRFDSPEVDCKKTKQKLATCTKDLSALTKLMQRTDGNPKTDAFFRRLSIILTNKLTEMQDHMPLTPAVAIQFDLNHKFVQKVSRLIERGVNESTPVALIVDEVSDVVIPLLQKSFVRDRESFWVQYVEHLAIAAASVIVLIFLYLLLQKKVYAVTMTSFLISVLWEWRRLYEEETVRKELTVMKGPANCGTQWHKYLTSGLLQVFSFSADSSDPCHKYYSSVGVKTILKCNPLLAVQNVLGMIFGRSFAVLAEYAGEATQKYFSYIPWVWTPVVGAAVVVVMVFAMTFSFGYDVRSPFISLTRNSRPSVLHLTRTHRLPAPITPDCSINCSHPQAAALKLGSGDRGRSAHKSAAALRTQSLDRISSKTCES